MPLLAANLGRSVGSALRFWRGSRRPIGPRPGGFSTQFSSNVPEVLRGPLKPQVARIFDKYYGDWDPLYLAHKVQSYATPDAVVLEVGAGAGKLWPHGLRRAVAKLIGIDPSQQIVLNKEVDQAVIAWCEKLPFRNHSFDVVFSHSVAEHFPDPFGSFREIARVLKPGGTMLLQTPNLFYYAMVMSRLTPPSISQMVPV